MTHPYRPNGVYEHKTSVRYSKSDLTGDAAWGMEKTDLVLHTPVGAYCVGPDGNVWWVPFGSEETISGHSALDWSIARNARDEDLYTFGDEVPFMAELAGRVAAYCLSVLVEESLEVVLQPRFAVIAEENLERVYSWASWLMSLIDWDAVGECYA